MFARSAEATPVPSKASRVSRSELRWLFHQLPKAGVPLQNRSRPVLARIPVIDLTGDDSDSGNQSRRVRSRHERRSPSEDHRYRPSSNSHYASFPFRRRETSPESPRQQAPNSQIPHGARKISRLATTNKRKEPESADSDEESDTWSWKRLRPRRVLPSVEVDAERETLFHDDIGHDLSSSTEYEDDYDEDESGGKSYDVERVIAEKRSRMVHAFLLAWVGYEELDWVSARDCCCDELIAEFRAVPRVDVSAESWAARELEEERVQRSESAAYTRAPRLPKVRYPRANGAGPVRNVRTGRFERRAVHEDRPRTEWEVAQLDKESEVSLVSNGDAAPKDIWEIVASDAEPDEYLVSNDNGVWRDGPANTTHMPLTRLIPSRCDSHSPPEEAGRLSSKPASLDKHDTKQDDEPRFSIRQTPFDTNAPSRPRNIDDNSQRPRQTARISRSRDVPYADMENSSPKHLDNAMSVSSIRSRSRPSHSEIVPRPPSHQVMISRATQTSPRAFRTSTSRSEATPDLVQRQISHVAPAQDSRQRHEDSGACKPSAAVESSIEESKQTNQEGKAEGRSASGRVTAEHQVARERSPPTDLVDSEMTGNEGNLGTMKQRVRNMLSSALKNAPSDPSTRDSPDAAESRARARSFSSQTQAFKAEIERVRFARQDTGPVRHELIGDVSRHYAQGLVTRAKEYSEPSQKPHKPRNNPYSHHPETSFGFSLSSDSIVMESIENDFACLSEKQLGSVPMHRSFFT